MSLRAIKEAKSSIALQIYGLTDREVITLLEKRAREGLDVKIFYDKSASKNLPLSLHAYPVKSGGLMHRKILVIDEKLTLIGTANYTTQSLKMHDNLILGVRDPLFARFLLDSSRGAGRFEVADAHVSSFLLPDAEKEALKALIHQIDHAEESISVAMFTLTHPRLIHHLSQAMQRGVEVCIAIDRYTSLGASRRAVDTLKKAGAVILASTGSQLLHHKWALIDGKTLILGSANWTKSAFSKNQDCLLIIEELKPKEVKKLELLWKNVAIASKKR